MTALKIWMGYARSRHRLNGVFRYSPYFEWGVCDKGAVKRGVAKVLLQRGVVKGWGKEGVWWKGYCKRRCGKGGVVKGCSQEGVWQRGRWGKEGEVAKIGVWWIGVYHTPWPRTSHQTQRHNPPTPPHPPVETSTEASGTHPTGMHSCSMCDFCDSGGAQLSVTFSAIVNKMEFAFYQCGWTLRLLS